MLPQNQKTFLSHLIGCMSKPHWLIRVLLECFCRKLILKKKWEKIGRDYKSKIYSDYPQLM